MEIEIPTQDTTDYTGIARITLMCMAFTLAFKCFIWPFFAKDKFSCPGCGGRSRAIAVY